MIVTNALEGWVEYSSYYLMPRVHKIIKESIPVLSAQSKYGHLPLDVWKTHAFREAVAPFRHSSLLNLLVLGDSDLELEAGRALKAEIDHTMQTVCLLKLIKL